MSEPRFFIGQQILHKRFNYRGLIYGIDEEFRGTEAWYKQMARSKPPKDEPWYHVLVHEADHTTYVAERNMTPYEGDEYIDHPLLPAYFDGFKDGVYVPLKAD